MATEIIRAGGCLCGDVRYSVRGDPFKSGLCHCADCRKVTGSAFLAYADWRPAQFEYSGKVQTYRGRSFCPNCGSRLFSRNERQVEIYIGTLDSVPSGIAPIDEGWIIRREPWQPPIEAASQHEKDVPPHSE
ncbi:GFA family protein [Bradyrhizobium sp. CCBAU 51745]|uniref:GFA family protein n=1 Tax=Bradyrhizobium sp. CCBAU 51745 TaxID=1325099 RepID=UPI0023060EAC|nr:GFA family protein [Bradyrhizobium sp. CCBAU 51745]